MSDLVKIDFIGHATILVKVGKLNVLIDPHLHSTYRHGLFGYYPERVVKKQNIVEDVDIVIISHSHRDHFDPASLKLFSENTVFFIPHDRRIQHALKTLGFLEVFVVSDWTSFELAANFRITVTPSTYKVPEHGFFMQIGELAVWNLVDSHVKDSWCRKVLDINNGKTIDYALIPTQPLIEGNSTSVIGPYATSERVNEVSRIVDILKPVYVIPFADGHYCKNRSFWLNSHWMPFDSNQKWDAIDKANYKPQVLNCDAGDSLQILTGDDSYRHSITDSFYVHRTNKVCRPFFFPAYTIDPSASYKQVGDSLLDNAFNCLFSHTNLNKVSSRLKKYCLKSAPSTYLFILLDSQSNKLMEHSLFWNGEIFTKSNSKLLSHYEIVCGAAEFLALFESRLEFSAALIGGFLREIKIDHEYENRNVVLRSLADLINDVECWSISGIFMLNQLLLLERDRIVIEVTKALNGDSLIGVGPIDKEGIWNKNYSIEMRKNKYDDFVIELVRELLDKKIPFWEWSGVREHDGENVFFGFMDGINWNVPEGVECVLVPINLIGPQSVFGCGVGSSNDLAMIFYANVKNLKGSVSNICLGLVKGKQIPLWRMVDLFPAINKYLVDLLKYSTVELDNGLLELANIDKPWWLGYPPATSFGEPYCLTVKGNNGQVFRGSVNSTRINGLCFKNQLSFIAYTGSLKNESIDRLLQGDVRTSWIQPENIWKNNELHNWSEIKKLVSVIASEVI